MHIRTASLADAAALAAVEAACFPPAEAATAAEITDRLAYYADHFWLLEEDDGTLVSFVDGMTTDEPTLRDEMYEDAALHDEDGTWQMIFGVNTLPAYRCRGCAGAVLERDALRFAADQPFRFENQFNSTARLLLTYRYLK